MCMSTSQVMDRMKIMLHDECVSSTLPYVPFTRGLKVRLLLATLFVTWEVQHTNIHTFKPRGVMRRCYLPDASASPPPPATLCTTPFDLNCMDSLFGVKTGILRSTSRFGGANSRSWTDRL
jgi:hypothetical protein